MGNQEVSERKFIPKGEDVYVTEWIVITGVKVPRFLITMKEFVRRMNEAGVHYTQEAAIKAEGTATEDAGDTHGQYHNEVAWYREQEAGVSQVLGDAASRNLDKAVVVPDMETIRLGMMACGVDPAKIVTLGSKVNVSFGEGDEEKLLVVPELESQGKFHSGMCSVDTPMGNAILGHVAGDEVQYSVKQGRFVSDTIIHQVKVKILDIE
jgi:hypothetical protein